MNNEDRIKNYRTAARLALGAAMAANLLALPLEAIPGLRVEVTGVDHRIGLADQLDAPLGQAA